MGTTARFRSFDSGEYQKEFVVANRKYTEDQRAEAVRLISVEGETAASVARDLSVSVGTVHRWVSDAMTARSQDAPEAESDDPTTARVEREELETQLGYVLQRIGTLETQFQQLARRTGSHG